MTIYTELTPNPATLKFIVDRVLLPQGTADFPSAEDAAGKSKLAERLFKYPFVQGIFIGRNFITVTKDEGSKWEDVIPVIKEDLGAYLHSGEPIVEGVETVSIEEDDDETVKKIKTILDEQVRPAVAMDGGDIIYEGFDAGVLRLRLQGSCSGCPSSTVTLKQGIESLMKRMFPNEISSVEGV